MCLTLEHLAQVWWSMIRKDQGFCENANQTAL
jgi:hypothetical protein